MMVRRGALERAEVKEIFTQLGHALAAAHAVDIVHRDLKPENVFLARSRRQGAALTVKVLDFGIAKVVAKVQSMATLAVGTPLWMAPEQTTMGVNITPAADMWALGLIAFYLLTGRSYWLGANVEKPSQIRLLREVAFDPLARASERAAALGCTVALPPGFDAWFARCVNREIGERFASAAELVGALAPLLEATATPSLGRTVVQPPIIGARTAAGIDVRGGTEPMLEPGAEPSPIEPAPVEPLADDAGAVAPKKKPKKKKPKKKSSKKKKARSDPNAPIIAPLPPRPQPGPNRTWLYAAVACAAVLVLIWLADCAAS
jgi:serine/threonine protein kinase